MSPHRATCPITIKIKIKMNVDTTSASDSEINVTLYHPPTSKTDAISISKLITVEELAELAVALLDLADDADGGDGGKEVALARSMDGNNGMAASAAAGMNSLEVLYQQGMAKNRSLESCSITDGTLILVYRMREFEMVTKRSAAGGRNGNAVGSGSGGGASNSAAAGGGSGSLDFSALLGGSRSGHTTSSSAMTPMTASGIRNNNARGGGGGSLDFSALLASSSGVRNGTSSISSSNNNSGIATANVANNSNTNNAITASIPIEWDGMTLDAAIQHNPNPHHLMSILTNTTRHPNLFKELNYHQPTLCKQLQSANGNLTQMANIWRINTMKSTTSRYLKYHTEKSKEESMKQRLLIDPTDAIANEYFGHKIRLSNVQAQYEQMMEDYPESMGRVLMLYIHCTVNDAKHPLQVFVDSGAQNTIMSGRCAERLNISHLIDTRFAGVAVGVGTGKIAGRIHMVILTINGYDFPCSITVMEDGNDDTKSTGLGNKNMDCLFGLDMLKRHRCCIDLEKNVLRFAIGGGTGQGHGQGGGSTVEYMEAPFLHEKDLPTSKGGTMDFNPEEENALVEARMEKMETDDEDGEEERGENDTGAGKKGE